MKKIDKDELRQLVLDGITTKDLNDKYDYSGIKDMSFLFHQCKELETIPELETKNVRYMNAMFFGCESLTKIPKLNTDIVETTGSMFYGCKVLTEIPYLETKKVTSMYSMFSGCKALTTIPKLNTDIVTTMRSMFEGCTSLTSLPYLETKNVNEMALMFKGCTSFSGDLSKWNVGNLNDVENMFENITINPSIFNWDLPSLKRYNFQRISSKKEFNELKKVIGRLDDLIAFL